MWKVFVLVNLAALHSAVGSTVPIPVNVTFSSVNLRNVLQWQPGSGTPSDRHFTVQYAIHGDSIGDSQGRRRARWRAAKRCTGIVQCWCDLSSEMWDVEEGYFAKVRATASKASSKWALAGRFDPKTDTTFGPPLLSVESKNSSAIITLKGPIRYQPDHQKPAVDMATLYPQMMYNLSIHNTRRSKMSHVIVTSNLYKHQLMEYDTEYCFSAQAKFLSMLVQCQSSAWHCITTPQDPMILHLQRIILSTAIPFMFMCGLVLVIYLLYHYLNGSGQKTPSLLNEPFTCENLMTTPPEKAEGLLVSYIVLHDIKSDVRGTTNPECRPLISEPPPPYARQLSPAPDDAEMSWEDENSDYGVLSVDSQQKPIDFEVEGPILEGRIAEEAKEGSGRQRVCTNYASQNLGDLPIISDGSSDDYGVVGQAACGGEKNDDEQEEDEQDEGTIFIGWDPTSRKLMVPQSEFALNGGFNWVLQEVESKFEVSKVERAEASAAVSGTVLLDSVFVRQSSEEAAEAKANLDAGVETECKVDNFLSEWKLVVAMDE